MNNLILIEICKILKISQIPLHIMKEFIVQCETLLTAANVESNGLADGDISLGGK
jgi:hypothetical protein